MARATRCLLLLRHGKAAGENPGGADIERPLVERGEWDAVAIGAWLRTAVVSPDLVLCSPARRARQTWEIAARALPWAPPVRVAERIYQADADFLLELVRETDDAVGTVLLVGHNPAVRQLAFDLTDAEAVRDGFPAAALAMLGVSGDWAALAPSGATLDSFVPPSGH